MNIKQIHNLAIKMGKKADLREKSAVDKSLKRIKEKYQNLQGWEKQKFDEQRLVNPYPDTRILFDAKTKNIKKY